MKFKIPGTKYDYTMAHKNWKEALDNHQPSYFIAQSSNHNPLVIIVTHVFVE